MKLEKIHYLTNQKSYYRATYNQMCLDRNEFGMCQRIDTLCVVFSAKIAIVA